MMRRLLIYLAAAALIVVGLAFSVTPIPLGAPLIGIALIMLVATSRNAARFMLASRKGVPFVDRCVGFLEARGGERFRKALRRTRPGRLPKRTLGVAGRL
ncbi:hypothetical protein ACUN0C_07270 [Faunimonas sp. B44]|uniref:hypothetical protein n=1 Tax=Faunimonas sp. B44 TaxID=3461493 RepID=UPI0040448B81